MPLSPPAGRRAVRPGTERGHPVGGRGTGRPDRRGRVHRRCTPRSSGSWSASAPATAPSWAGRDATARLDGSPAGSRSLLVSVLGALSGAVGLYWDVSYHISLGRDEGPLANPSHYLIFLGLVAIFAGARSPSRSPRTGSPAYPRPHPGLVPVGPAIGTGVALFALLGFPRRPVAPAVRPGRHGVGPDHVIGGALMLPYTMLTCAEARQAGPSARPLLEWVAILVLAAGPVAFLLEFAYGVPQFPLVNDLVVLTVAWRTLAMFRGARWVVSIWSRAALQGGLVALNVAVFGRSTWPPSLLGGALVAAVLARRPGPPGVRRGGGRRDDARHARRGVPRTQATRPMPWPAEMMPWAVLFAGLTGAGVGVVATWMHQRLTTVATAPATPTAAAAPPPHPRRRTPAAGQCSPPSRYSPCSWSTCPSANPARGSVDVAVGEVRDGRAYLTVTADPRLVHGAYWFEALSWQGGGVVHGELEPTGPGVWRTDEPMPLAGDWKTLVRLHTPLHGLAAAPVYLPADPAIPAAEHPAVSGPTWSPSRWCCVARRSRTSPAGSGVPGTASWAACSSRCSRPSRRATRSPAGATAYGSGAASVPVAERLTPLVHRLAPLAQKVAGLPRRLARTTGVGA